MSERALPSGWRRSNLIGLADYHNGAAYDPAFFGEQGLPIIRIEQINNPSSPTDFYDGPLSPNNRISDGDLVFSWSATLKAVIWKHGDGALNQHLFKVIPKSEVDKCFLHQVLDHHMERIASGSHGSTMKHITRKELQRYHVELPDSDEIQRRIATILTTLDEVIEATEKLVEKHQQLKAGLMHDLFTRGLWTRPELARGDQKGLPCEATAQEGQLRPTPEEAPGLYQDSPIGLVPKEWAVNELRNWLSYLSYGFTNPMPESEDGPYMVTAADVTGGGVQYETCRRTTRIAYDRLLTEKSRPKIGDVLLTKDGTLGRIAIVEREDVCINQSVAVLRPANLNHSKFLAEMLSSPKWQQKMIADAGGSTIKHIYITVIDKMLVGWPIHPSEADAIVTQIESANQLLELEKQHLAKLRQQKQGLMHDLLTGWVRVDGLANS